MTTCPSCGYQNPFGTEFCEACGSEMSLPVVEAPIAPVQIELTTSPIPPIPQPIQQTYADPIPTLTNIPSLTTAGVARLIAKQTGAPVSEISLDGINAIVGRFDPDTGPVEVDLEGFSGDETISRNHAEIYQESGYWKIKDLASTNGVFIKRSGQMRFGARITIPETISSGDEIAFGKVRFLFQG